jgi:hypothetical protein
MMLTPVSDDASAAQMGFDADEPAMVTTFVSEAHVVAALALSAAVKTTPPERAATAQTPIVFFITKTSCVRGKRRGISATALRPVSRAAPLFPSGRVSAKTL